MFNFSNGDGGDAIADAVCNGLPDDGEFGGRGVLSAIPDDGERIDERRPQR